MLTVQKSLDELIDDTLQEVGRYDERGYRVVLDAVGLPTVGATTCSLTDATRINVSDVLEFGAEMVLVTGKTSDPVPVLTVARGYDGTIPATHAPSSLGMANPQFGRRRVGLVVQQAFTRLDQARVFCVTSTVMNRTVGKQYIEMPSNTRQVLRVGIFDTTTNRFDEQVDGWRFFDDIPTTVVTSGKIVRLPRFISDTDNLSVTYRIPYRWSSYPTAPTGPESIVIPEGCQDLPSMYATARLISRRELSRLDLDRSEEWNRSQGVVNGITQGAVRQAWSEFYKSLDEAKTLNVFTVPRPYVTLRRFL